MGFEFGGDPTVIAGRHHDGDVAVVLCGGTNMVGPPISIFSTASSRCNQDLRRWPRGTNSPLPDRWAGFRGRTSLHRLCPPLGCPRGSGVQGFHATIHHLETRCGRRPTTLSPSSRSSRHVPPVEESRRCAPPVRGRNQRAGLSEHVGARLGASPASLMVYRFLLLVVLLLADLAAAVLVACFAPAGGSLGLGSSDSASKPCCRVFPRVPRFSPSMAAA